MALEGVKGQQHAPAASTPGKEPVPIIQEAGWVPGLVWTGAENLVHTRIRSPDRPARGQSLYRLSYPAHVQYKRGREMRLETPCFFYGSTCFDTQCVPQYRISFSNSRTLTSRTSIPVQNTIDVQNTIPVDRKLFLCLQINLAPIVRFNQVMDWTYELIKKFWSENRRW